MRVDKSSPTLYISIFAISFFLKIFLSWLLPLVPDEAYYWVWSHHRQWSYFDHPPFVSWLFVLGQFFEAFGSAVRWPAVLMGQCTFVLWFFIAREFLSDKYLFWFTFLYLANPLLGPGSIIVTPDIPLLFFWSLGVFLLLRIHSTPHIGYFLAYGAVVGLGFCSKYNMALEALVALASLLFSPKLRRQFLPHVLVSIGVAVIFSLPVLLWNYHHDFTSFRFQFNKRLTPSKWNPEWTTTFVLGQLILISPTVLWSAYSKWPRTQNMTLLWMLTLPLPLFFLLSFRSRIEGNWVLAAYPSLLLLATYNSQAIRGLVITIVAHTVLMVGVLAQVYFPWIPYIKAEDLKTAEFFKFDRVAKQIKDLDGVFARSYQMAGKLSFDLKKDIYKLKGMNRHDFYDDRAESIPTQSPYYLIVEKNEPLPSWALSAGQIVVAQKPLEEGFVLLQVKLP